MCHGKWLTVGCLMAGILARSRSQYAATIIKLRVFFWSSFFFLWKIGSLSDNKLFSFRNDSSFIVCLAFECSKHSKGIQVGADWKLRHGTWKRSNSLHNIFRKALNLPEESRRIHFKLELNIETQRQTIALCRTL